MINAVANAFDIALLDIAGKHYDEPVWKLLGGRSTTRFPSTPTAGTSASARRRTTPATPRRPSRNRNIPR
ncbi:hypothetical protein [Halalkalicoccus salilacus]|uniref:hypothetical protein n=1 Tax=Halalkalicoccus sp. GCM10025704 TaxID=3252662 RepID=UPI003615CB1F